MSVAPTRKVIIDQDAFGPGGSNLQAILIVLQDPSVEVLGITIVSGDGWMQENLAHALRMLELVGRTDVPVFAGAEQPLVNSAERTRAWEARHGCLPYKGAWTEAWPEYNTMNRARHHAPEVVPPSPAGAPVTVAASGTAAEFIVRQLRAFPGEVTVLAMGPFTNLALAAQLEPGCGAQARELVFMGGSFNPDATVIDEFTRQFLHTPRVEFNCRWDPEAAAEMLRAGWPRITCVPLDATVGVRLTPELARRAGQGATAASRYVAAFGSAGFPMWDEVAAAVMLDPSLAAEILPVAMDIEVDGGSAYGATLSWSPGRGPGRGEVAVDMVRAIHRDRFAERYVEWLHRA